MRKRGREIGRERGGESGSGGWELGVGGWGLGFGVGVEGWGAGRVLRFPVSGFGFGREGGGRREEVEG